jgi:hypothetical protein
MGIFRFRLEKVSEHRQRQVDRCSLAVANANQRLEQIKKMQARLENDIQRQAQVMADRRGGEVSSRDFVAGNPGYVSGRKRTGNWYRTGVTAVKWMKSGSFEPTEG